MPTPNKYTRWQDLIGDGRDEEVLRELRIVYANSPRLKSVIQQRGRFSALQERIMNGTISYQDEQLTRNQLRHALLSLLEKLEREERSDAELAGEVAAAMIRIEGDVNKAAINSELTAGRDLHIGDKYITYQGEKIERILTEPPQRPPVFKGRDDALRELHDKLFSGQNDHLIMLVNGQGGVGKTSLASQYFFEYQEHYYHAAWLLKDGSIADALLQLATGLNLEFTTETNEERLRRILQKVANFSAPCLLVLDNANERQDLVKHVHLLRKCANFHVLLTSRLDNFDGIERYPVDALPEPVAKTLFEQYYRVFSAEEAELFPEIYRAVDGNTLILQLLAKNLKKNRRDYTLNELWADLREKGVFALSRSKKVVTDYGALREGQVEEIVTAMFNLEDLTAAQQRLLSVFAALPPERIPYPHLKVLVTFLDDLGETLDELQQLGWIEEDDSGEHISYRCSPVVRAVVRQQVGHWRAVLPELRSKINGQLATDGGYVKIGIEAARPYVGYGEAIADLLPPEAANLFFFQQLAHFYNASGDLLTNMEWIGRMSEQAQALLNDDPDNADLKNSLAISYSKLGETHSSMGNLEQALQYFELDIALSKELYAAYPKQVSFKNGLAISYEKLGSTHRSMGNLDKALEYFDLETKLFEELYAAYPKQVSFKNGLAISYEKLGETHSALGKLEQALQYFEEYNRLEKELFAAYPNQVSFKNSLNISHEKLGNIFLKKGELERAMDNYGKSHRILQELHSAYPKQVSFKNGLAISYVKLGEVAQDPAVKREQYQKAEQLWVELTEAFPAYAQFQRFLGLIRERLAEL